MSLKSALQDIKETTLSSVSGWLGKLVYLASLRRGLGRYEHWRTPLPSLLEDLKESSQNSGVETSEYVEEMRGRFDDLLPEGRQNTPVSTHLNSILVALSSLERNRGRATRSTT
jgi:hypothetical protein